MGTRNLTTVIDKNGDLKVAQYGQYDGYPAGQGLTALYHARNNAKLIESKLKLCHFLDEKGIEHINAGMTDTTDFSFEYPTLSRDTGADILGYVAYANPIDGEILLVDESDFANDDLFCEGIYSINFQSGLFTSKYAHKLVSFPLDDLPTKEEYLGAWE
jgi:hypothetical protein